jgi:hypothetical protein
MSVLFYFYCYCYFVVVLISRVVRRRKGAHAPGFRLSRHPMDLLCFERGCVRWTAGTTFVLARVETESKSEPARPVIMLVNLTIPHSSLTSTCCFEE